MKLLLDESVPKQIGSLFPDAFEVYGSEKRPTTTAVGPCEP